VLFAQVLRVTGFGRASAADESKADARGAR
jgi:hypothetical protein